MDAAQLSRWTRFAAKGGIGKCTALKDRVAQGSEDLMFLKDDEIVVLMQLADQDDVFLGYCEGVVGRFVGTYVRFHSKLKTPVMTKRSSTSKSPRSSLVGSSSQRRNVSQSPVPSLARAASREDTVSLRALVNSPVPVVPKRISFIAPPSIDPPPSDVSLVADISVGSSPCGDVPTSDSLMAPSTSYSSASSVQESASPQTPSDFRLEPVSKGETLEGELTRPGLHQDDRGDHGSHQTTSDIVRQVRASIVGPASPAVTEVSLDSSVPNDAVFDDSVSHRISRISVALSDGVSGIGLSLLQNFISGDGDDDTMAFSSDSDEHTPSREPGSRTSMSSTVEGFPVPPTHNPDPSALRPAHSASNAVFASTSHTASASISTLPPMERTYSPSMHISEDEWEGASDIYDNYRYSRLSMSSKMSKSSAQTQATGQEPMPPVPSEYRPSMDRKASPDTVSMRRPSVESQYSSVASVAPSFTGGTFSIAPEVTNPQPTSVVLALSNEKPRPAPLEFSFGSPLLHTSFGSPLSSPGLNTPSTAMQSPPLASAFSNGIATALRQQLEHGHEAVSTVTPSLPHDPSPSEGRGIVIEDDEDNTVLAPSVAEGETPPMSPPMSEKRRGGPPSPLIVVNQAPPPPYTPVSPPSMPPQVGPAPFSPISPVFNAMPTPTIPAARPRPAKPDAQHLAQRESMWGSARTSMFQPHPNAPKPSPISMGPMYGRAPPQSQSAPPTGGLIPTLQTASAARFGPNGRPRLTTIYGMTVRDLAESFGPVPIRFSLDPPNDIPANRLLPKRTATVDVIPTSRESYGEDQADENGTGAAPTPRANFFPRVRAARPRSRSFSGFDSAALPQVLPQKERSREEPIGKDIAPRESNAAVSGGLASSRMAPLQRRYAPSPLALSQTAAIPRSASSPLSAVSPGLHTPTSPRPPSSPRVQTLALPQNDVDAKSGSNAAQEPSPVGEPRRDPSLPSSPISPSAVPVDIPSSWLPIRPGTSTEGSFIARTSRTSLRHQTSVDTDISLQSDARSVVSPPPASSSGLVRNTSLRSKLSLSALRAKHNTPNIREDKQTFEEAARDNETVQVEDLDFELVRPSLPAARASEDSSIFGHASISGDGKAERPSFLRADSPAISMLSGSNSALRSPKSMSDMGVLPAAKGSTVEAHRARELKWIAAMASTPPSQARKSKKVKKLLQEGVPASVRYQVWAHLTDSKAKRLDGLYAQLGKREKVPVLAEIERDARQCFPADARLSEAGGSLVSLLQAYLTMVPDIQYHRGLAYIAGQLLLQSPEEDAFWIFISLMDTHLRPYFASNAIQMDVDASLFAKAVEATDASVAKKLFVDMSIPPIRIIRPWFSSLFVEALPTEYFQRVWDIFLSEGVVYLFRVGLAVMTLCRRTLLESSSEGQVLHILARPPAILMSTSPDILVELANSFKLKDDDIRKQRVKLEAQLKRQTQNRITGPGQRSSSSHLPSISLPRS